MLDVQKRVARPVVAPRGRSKADGHSGCRIVVANVIDAAAAIDPVGACATVERIIAVAAIELVVPAAAANDVVAVQAKDAVGLFVPFKNVVEIRAPHVFDGDVDIARRVAAGTAAGEAGDDASRRRAKAYFVNSGAAVEKVGSGAALE